MKFQDQSRLKATKPSVFSPMQGGLLQRKRACGSHMIEGGEYVECSKNKQALQRKASDRNAVSEVPPIVHEVLRSPGQPLDPATRSFMEPRFGYDFSQVRVHSDASAAESARVVNALAYTVGRDLVFGSGQYRPHTSSGKQLLAHELTHVLQQQSAQTGMQTKFTLGSVENSSEQEADAVAKWITSTNTVSPFKVSNSLEHDADRAANAMVAGPAFSLSGTTFGIARKVNNEQNPESSDAEIFAATDETATPPTQEKIEEARKYYTSLRDQSTGLIKSYNAELFELAKPPEIQSSIFGPEVDAKNRAQRKQWIEAQMADTIAAREVLAGNLALLASKQPEDQLRGVNRAEAVKTEFVNSEKPINPFIVLLTGAGKTSKSRTVELMTAGGVGQTTKIDDGTVVDAKEGKLESSVSKTVVTQENGKKTTSVDSTKVKYGLGGRSRTAEETHISPDGSLKKVGITTDYTAKDGRVGKATKYSAESGTESDGKLAKGKSGSVTTSKGMTMLNDSIGIDGGVSGTGIAQTDAQNKVSVTTALNGAATLAIKKDAKGQYMAVITLVLSGSLGGIGTLGKETKDKGTGSISMGGEGHASHTKVFSVPLTEAEVDAYKAEFLAAADGSATSRPNLHYVALLKTKGSNAVLAALAGGSEAARKDGLGYEQTNAYGISTSGSGSFTETGANTSTIAPTFKAGIDKKVKAGHHPKAGDPETLIVTIAIDVDVSYSGGISVSTGGASGGTAYNSKRGGGKTLSFEMKNSADLVAKLEAISTVEEAISFRDANASKKLEEGDRTAKSTGLSASMGLGFVSPSMTRTGLYEETVVKDADGKVVRTELLGANEIESSISVGQISAGSRKDTDQIKGTVNADKTANLNLDKSTTTKELDSAMLAKNMKEAPALTLFQLVTLSSAPAMKTETVTKHATKITEKDLASIAAIAEHDEADWVKAVGGDGKAMKDWKATRIKILNAKGDMTAIAKALAEFEDSWDSGRGDIVRRLDVGRYQAEWPPELAAERPEFERLADDNLKELVIATYRSKGVDNAVAQAGQLNNEIRVLLKKISDKSGSIQNPTLLAEMNRVLGVRASEMSYLKTDLPKQALKEHNAKREELINTQRAHGVDTMNKQTHHIPEVLKPRESISDQDLYKDPGEEQVEPQLSPEETKAQKKKELNEKIQPDLTICQTNRITEGEKLRWVEKQFDAGEDVRDLFPKLNEVKGMWPAWDEAVKRVLSTLEGTGFSIPMGDRGPRKEWWNEINKKLTGSEYRGG